MPIYLALFQRTRNSFDVNDIEAFATWLSQHGYWQEQIRNSVTEYVRFRGAHNGLVTIYHSGAVVLGGSAAGSAAVRALMNPLILTDHLPGQRMPPELP